MTVRRPACLDPGRRPLAAKLARAWRVACVAALAAVLLLAAAAPAAAHVARDVGAYRFLVGWGAEPAFAGQLNSVQLVLTYRATGKPVIDLGSSLQVTVVYGTQKMPLALVPTFDPDTRLGTPGDYRAWFIPTAPGDYTFHFTGTISVQVIDERFTSSPTTFATVQDPSLIEFPLRAPTAAELSQRIDAQIPRMATSSAASTARTLAMVGVVLGGLGLLIAVAAFVRRRT
jgi:hypothetical protein